MVVDDRKTNRSEATNFRSRSIPTLKPGHCCDSSYDSFLPRVGPDWETSNCGDISPVVNSFMPLLRQAIDRVRLIPCHGLIISLSDIHHPTTTESLLLSGKMYGTCSESLSSKNNFWTQEGGTQNVGGKTHSYAKLDKNELHCTSNRTNTLLSWKRHLALYSVIFVVCVVQQRHLKFH